MDQVRQIVALQHDLAHGALRQQRRTGDDALLAIQKDLQRPRQAADDALVAFGAIARGELAQRHLFAHGDAGLTRVPHQRQQALHLARRLLHAVHQRRQPRLAPPKATPAQDGERHQEHLVVIGTPGVHDLAQVVGAAAYAPQGRAATLEEPHAGSP